MIRKQTNLNSCRHRCGRAVLPPGYRRRLRIYSRGLHRGTTRHSNGRKVVKIYSRFCTGVSRRWYKQICSIVVLFQHKFSTRLNRPKKDRQINEGNKNNPRAAHGEVDFLRDPHQFSDINKTSYAVGKTKTNI